MERVERAIETYGDMVTKICIMNLRNTDDAKDCFQDVFIKYYHCFDEFESDEHLKAWFIRVTMNTCKDYRRKYYKKTIDIDEVVINYQKEEMVLLPILLTLPQKYKNILYLHYYEGYKINEIAHILHINENTVKSRLKRGRQLLKKQLGDDHYEILG